jgi:hypothetical protein
MTVECTLCMFFFLFIQRVTLDWTQLKNMVRLRSKPMHSVVLKFRFEVDYLGPNLEVLKPVK